MNYYVKATSTVGSDGSVSIKESNINFGTTESSTKILPNPTELFLAAFASCILKNLERFSKLMKFQYEHAGIYVTVVRLEHPPRLENIRYDLEIRSNDPKLNIELLKKNIERHGTIYNTVGQSAKISGEIIKVETVASQFKGI